MFENLDPNLVGVAADTAPVDRHLNLVSLAGPCVDRPVDAFDLEPFSLGDLPHPLELLTRLAPERDPRSGPRPDVAAEQAEGEREDGDV